LSTTLFNIAIQTTNKKVHKRGNTYTKLSQICAYSDDLTIMTRTKNELKRVYLTLEKEANQFGLYTNLTKTKYMHLNTNISERMLCIGDKTFEIVQKFIYLRAVVDEENNIIHTIQERIQSCNKAYYANLQLLKSNNINRTMKMKMYKTLTCPIVTLSSEVWVLKKEDKNNLRSERKINRKRDGPIKQEQWRIRNNEEIFTNQIDRQIATFISYVFRISLNLLHVSASQGHLQVCRVKVFITLHL
jgi:hypothetical protein